MYVAYKLTRGLIRSIVSAAAPWQLFTGAFLGSLLGFLPMWPVSQGPSPLWFAILLVALFLNCHLGSVLLFLGIGKLLGALLAGPAVLIGQSMNSFAQGAADVPLLYASHLSHTGWLGRTVLGLCFGLLFAILLTWLAIWLRGYLKRINESNRLASKMGKLANRPFMVRCACWFFGL
jgi:hypothetical protein